MKPINKPVCSLAALAPLAMAQSANAGQRPNIIFFLVDDFGWTETSLPFGEETYPNNLRFHTPNMERLARTGVMMTNAYACPVSTPTRTSMMTGMNAAHMGITSYCSLYKDTCPDAIGGRPGTTNANEDDIFAHPEWNYNALCPASFRNEADSIAYGLNRTLYATPMVEILRDAGYHTIHVGKAHWAPTGTPGSNPYNMGFTVNIAGSGNGHPQSYLPEEHFGNLPQRGTYASVQNMSQYYGSGIHLTEALTLEALKTLEDPIRRKQPFYLYFAHYSNHTPIQRDERFIRKYLDAGMDEQQARYASMVEGMDKSLGDVLDYLEAKGIADDTIILFMSDNGGHCLGQDKGGEPHTQNLPLREGKASVYEGGIRVPLIFRWPGKAAEGTRLNTPVINEDIFPTILEMAGVKHYETVQECDGLSLARLITAGSKMVAKAQKRGEIATRKEANAFVVPASVSGVDPERELIFHYPHQYRVEDQDDIDFMSAVRKGDWKLVYRMHTISANATTSRRATPNGSPNWRRRWATGCAPGRPRCRRCVRRESPSRCPTNCKNPGRRERRPRSVDTPAVDTTSGFLSEKSGRILSEPFRQAERRTERSSSYAEARNGACKRTNPHDRRRYADGSATRSPPTGR